MSHDPEDWGKIWRKTDVVSKMTRIWWIVTRALESLKICTFNGSCCAKYLMFELKMYIAVWKMAWGIWQIFTRAVESLKIGTLMGSFNPK